jgi:hypothetical protein
MLATRSMEHSTLSPEGASSMIEAVIPLFRLENIKRLQQDRDSFCAYNILTMRSN